ncbi:hypothetical protein K491DRAFT_302610 [Lophiostoma macrostomum CBS 122681]|uniref:Uncharacterized protein n=1 Tax=Lophiostoma macrostomum CBS 122681 TaxID=1314788 RepID=A0A6A6TDC6_9PLEO|nr:hypothetical protein K491DRAFT_302610 [Lophiostoma macrostomum CBS 122681]
MCLPDAVYMQPLNRYNPLAICNDSSTLPPEPAKQAATLLNLLIRRRIRRLLHLARRRMRRRTRSLKRLLQLEPHSRRRRKPLLDNASLDIIPAQPIDLHILQRIIRKIRRVLKRLCSHTRRLEHARRVRRLARLRLGPDARRLQHCAVPDQLVFDARRLALRLGGFGALPCRVHFVLLLEPLLRSAGQTRAVGAAHVDGGTGESQRAAVCGAGSGL